MRKKISAFTLFVLCLSITFHESTSVGQEFKLYRTTVDDWYNNDHVTKLQDLIITEANSYCSSSPEQCGLPYWNETSSFQRSDVVVSDGYPQENVDLVVKFYITSNFSADEPEVILSSDATKEIFLNIKTPLEDKLGTYVTFVGDEFYGIPIDDMANRIIIPIAFGVLVIIAIIAIALTIWSNAKEKERYKFASKKSLRMSRNANNLPKTKPEKHSDTENNLMKNNPDHQENKHLEHKHISPIANNQTYPSVSEASYLNEAKQRHNELPPLNSAENGLAPINSNELGASLEESDTSQVKKHHKKRKSKKKKKKEEKMSQENSALEESETEDFTQSHMITNVQPNNVPADETIL